MTLRHCFTPPAPLPTTAVSHHRQRWTAHVLSEEELLRCHKLGTARQHNNNQSGVHDAIYAANRSSTAIHVQGVVGEYVWRSILLYNGKPVPDSDPLWRDHAPKSKRKRTDDEHDCAVGPVTYDVKTTHDGTRELRVRKNAAGQPAAYYVQMIVENGRNVSFDVMSSLVSAAPLTVYCAGVISAAALFCATNLQVRHPGTQFYVIRHENLDDIRDHLLALSPACPATPPPSSPDDDDDDEDVSS